MRQEALTLVDLLLCAEAAVRRQVAEEHHRRGLLVRALQPRSGSHSWGTWPTSCSLSASGCVDGFHHEAPFIVTSLFSFWIRDGDGVWGQRVLGLQRSLRSDLVLGCSTWQTPFLSGGNLVFKINQSRDAVDKARSGE